MNMAKTKSSTFYRSIILVLFLVFWVSLETAAKDGKFSASRNDTKGANAPEWLEPAGDEAIKRSIFGGRSSGKGGRGGQGKSGGNSPGKGSGRKSPGKGSECPGSEGTGSKCPPSRSQPTDPGYIYVIQMSGGQGINSPLLAKVGFTNNLNQRLGNLIAGNPFKLQYAASGTWRVCNKNAAEQLAHAALSGLQYYVGGGTEWYRYPSRGLTELIQIVGCAIDEYIEVNPAGSSSRSRSRGRNRNDFVESSIYPNLAPNQAGSSMATNYGHLKPRFAGVYNTKWRQELKGNALKIKYNCK